LMVIHQDNLLPIIGYLIQIIGAGNIHKVEYIFLETRASKANRCFEEFWTYPAIHSNRASHLVDIGTCFFAKLRYRIDGRNTLCQESVGGQFRSEERRVGKACRLLIVAIDSR